MDRGDWGYRSNWRIWTHWCYRIYWLDGSCRYCFQYGCDRTNGLEWTHWLDRTRGYGDEYRSDGADGLYWTDRLDRTRGNCHQYGCNR